MLFESEFRKTITRRAFFGRASSGLGGIALASLLGEDLFAAAKAKKLKGIAGTVNPLHFAPKAKRVIYLFMSGAPSHIDLFDYKPKLVEMTGNPLPDSARPAHHRHDERAKASALRRHSIQVREAWQVRHGAFRIAAAHREGGG
jgi:hypothetical protein